MSLTFCSVKALVWMEMSRFVKNIFNEINRMSFEWPYLWRCQSWALNCDSGTTDLILDF